MRINIVLLLSLGSLGLYLWTILSGASLLFGMLLWVIVIVISISYSDLIVLYLLGAREIRSSDQKDFFEACSQEAYKLSVKIPRLYFYSGELERAFILQAGSRTSIVMSKSLLDKSSVTEMRAISFELLLQVKRGMAPRRTRAMFLLGIMSWCTHSFAELILLLIPSRNFKRSVRLYLNLLLNPCLEFVFVLTIGNMYFKKLATQYRAFPEEFEHLGKLGMKLNPPSSYYSLSSRKLLELSATIKSRNYQNVIALEFLPHEWDFFFRDKGLKRAE